MAGEDIFSSLFSQGARGSDADLTAFQRTVAANDVYGQIAAPLLAAKFNTSTWSPGQTIATTAGQAFLGTILSQLGQRNQGLQLERAASVLPQLYKDPLSVALPEGVDSQAFGGLRLAALKDRAQIGDRDSDARDKLFAEVFSKNPSLAVGTMPDLAKKFDIKIPQQSEEPPAPEPTVDGIPGLASGKETTAKKLGKYYQEFVSQGMPATQASVAARQQVDGEIKANTSTFNEAKAARDYGQKLIDMASTAKAGMSQAGETGPYNSLASAYESVANLFGSQEASTQLAGDAVLSSIAPEVIKMSRSPGAVSDFESRLYLGAGPNTNQTPETNAILTKKMEDLGRLNLDYADFLDAYREMNAGSTIGAAKKWAEYRQAFPIFKGTNDKIELNENRPSWQEFFSGQARQADDLRIGGTFQGETIKAIRKIK